VLKAPLFLATSFPSDSVIAASSHQKLLTLTILLLQNMTIFSPWFQRQGLLGIIVHVLGNLDSIELNSFRKTTPGFDIGRPCLGPAWLSTITMMTARLVGIRCSSKVSLEKRFESWCRGTDESDVYFESDEDPEDVTFPCIRIS